MGVLSTSNSRIFTAPFVGALVKLVNVPEGTLGGVDSGAAASQVWTFEEHHTWDVGRRRQWSGSIPGVVLFKRPGCLRVAVFKHHQIGRGEIVDGVMLGVGCHNVDHDQVRVGRGGRGGGSWFLCRGRLTRRMHCRAERGCNERAEKQACHATGSWLEYRVELIAR